MKLKFNSVSDVQDFCKIASQTGVVTEVHPINRRYTVDGASIMGLMSLDLSNPVEVVIHTDDEKLRDQFIMNCKYWIVEGE